MLSAPLGLGCGERQFSNERKLAYNANSVSVSPTPNMVSGDEGDGDDGDGDDVEMARQMTVKMVMMPVKMVMAMRVSRGFVSGCGWP
jgi:hypothetical protein